MVNYKDPQAETLGGLSYDEKMNFSGRFCALLLALTLAFALAPAVRADVLSPIGIVASVIDLKTVLIAVAAVAVLSGIFLWITRKK